ncbi:MAG: potassium channel family protein [Ferrimicrobium sp.]
MKVAIIGAGNVGAFLAKDLVDSGHDVLVIDNDSDLVTRIALEIPCTWVVADGCEVSVLAEAGLASCDVCVAATGDDEDNLVTSLLAKQEFMVPRVIARVNHPKNHWLFNKSWGVDIAVSTPHLISGLVEEAVSVGSLVRLFQLQRSGAHLVEVTLAPDSPAIDATIAGLDLPKKASIVAIMRGTTVIVPRGDVVLRADDEVIALVIDDADDELRTRLIGTRESK